MRPTDKILLALLSEGKHSDTDLRTKQGMSRSSATRGRQELLAVHLIEDSGKTRGTKTGIEPLWVLTPKGHGIAQLLKAQAVVSAPPTQGELLL